MEIKKYSPVDTILNIPSDFYEIPEGKKVVIESPFVCNPSFYKELATQSDRHRVELGLRYFDHNSVQVTRGDYHHIDNVGSEDGHTHPGVSYFPRNSLPSGQDVFNSPTKNHRIISSVGVVETTDQMTESDKQFLLRKSPNYDGLNLYELLRHIYPYAPKSVAEFFREHNFDVNVLHIFSPESFRSFDSTFLSRMLAEAGFIKSQSETVSNKDEDAVTELKAHLRLLYSSGAVSERVDAINTLLRDEISNGILPSLIDRIVERSPNLRLEEVVELVGAYTEGIENPTGHAKWLREMLDTPKVSDLDYKKLFTKGFAAINGLIIRNKTFTFPSDEISYLAEAKNKLHVSLNNRGGIEGVVDNDSEDDDYKYLLLYIDAILPSREIAYFVSERTDIHLVV